MDKINPWIIIFLHPTFKQYDGLSLKYLSRHQKLKRSKNYLISYLFTSCAYTAVTVYLIILCLSTQKIACVFGLESHSVNVNRASICCSFKNICPFGVLFLPDILKIEFTGAPYINFFRNY